MSGLSPTFPNARYLVGRRELADWEARIAAGVAAPMHVRGLRDSVFPLVEVGRVDLVDAGLELAAGAALTLLPGHTVGQMGLRIDRPEARALFCGDVMHSPLQIVQPAVSTSSCSDPQLATLTRIAVLEEAAASGRVVVPAHFRGPRRVTVAGVLGGSCQASRCSGGALSIHSSEGAIRSASLRENVPSVRSDLSNTFTYGSIPETRHFAGLERFNQVACLLHKRGDHASRLDSLGGV
jgi:hypothetical protein